MGYGKGAKDTAAWMFFVWASFCSAVLLMALGVWHLPTDYWVKGYLAMGTFFLVGSTFTLAKTIRDNAEAEKAASGGELKTDKTPPSLDYERRQQNFPA